MSRRVAFVLLFGASTALALACEATRGAPARAPDPVPGCWLENAMAQFGDPSAVPNCGMQMPEGICGEACAKAVHDCVLSSARAFRPFSIAWTNHMHEGVGTRRGVAGRAFDGGFEVTWIEYTFVSGFNPNGGELAKARVRVVARRCRDMDDLLEVCDARLSASADTCRGSAREQRDNVWLHCIGDEEPFCSD